MAEHYTRSTESVTKFCNTCGRITEHSVSDGRVGRCKEHHAPELTKKQQENRERLERAKTSGEREVRGEGLGRNIKEQLLKAPQLEGLAPCGDPNCAGCYVVGFPDADTTNPSTVRIHPPRSDY